MTDFNTACIDRDGYLADQRGFTLIELAIVMFIIALLLSGVLLPLSSQQDVRSYADTQKVLAEARDALVGYAMANDRLPCPASSTSHGQEDPVGGGTCNHPYDGFFPAVTVGIAPIDSSGYLLDGWGGDPVNRVRYSLTTAANTNAFSTQNGMKTTGMSSLAPDLKVCNSGTGITNHGMPTAACAANAALTTEAVAVIYSVGKNAASGGTTTDEGHNPNPQATIGGDPVFVNASQGPSFDDQMIWLSKGALFNRLVAAGRLP